MSESGSPADRPLFDVLRQLRGRVATGALELESGGTRRRLFLREGELHLPGVHPLARQLRERLEALGRQPALARDPGEPLFDLIERIAEVLADWKPDRWEFHEGLAHLPAELAGPLPTARLLMAGAVAGLDDAAIEARVAAAGQRWVAVPGLPASRDPLGPLPEELFVLERLRLPMPVGELAADSPIPRAELLRCLLRLAAAGAVRPHRPGEAATPARGHEREFVARISERIGRNLEEHPLALDPERYRTLIADLLSRHGGLDHYELLGVSASATAVQIQAAFERLARLAHPTNATRFGSAGSESALAILFERATRAYETLMDPERRRVYNERELIDVPASGPTGTRRETERREVGRTQFQRAQAYAGAGDFHNAILLLEQAVQTDPRSEYWAMLGRLQARNPAWKSRALESFRHALLTDPQNADAHFASAQFYEQLGEIDRARVQYQATVRLDPGHLEAAARLASIDERRAATQTKGAGLLSRFFRRT